MWLIYLLLITTGLVLNKMCFFALNVCHLVKTSFKKHAYNIVYKMHGLDFTFVSNQTENNTINHLKIKALIRIYNFLLLKHWSGLWNTLLLCKTPWDLLNGLIKTFRTRRHQSWSAGNHPVIVFKEVLLQREGRAEKTNTLNQTDCTIILISCWSNYLQHCSELQEWVCPPTDAEQGYAGAKKKLKELFWKSNMLF